MTLSHSRSAAAICAVLFLAAACSRNDPSSFLSSAQSYMQKADYKAAIVQLKNVIQGAPENAEARYLLAKALLETGDFYGCPGFSQFHLTNTTRDFAKLRGMHSPNKHDFQTAPTQASVSRSVSCSTFPAAATTTCSGW